MCCSSQPEPALTDQSRHRERCNSRSRARRTVLATFGKLLRFFQKSLDLSLGALKKKKKKKKNAPHIQPQGGLSLPVQQSRKLPSDAVRVPPSVASLCLFSVRRGSPSGAADPRLPSVTVWRLRMSFRVALRARWRTGLPLPVQQSRWLPSVVMGALLPTRQTAPCIKPQGGLSPPVQQSRSSLRTQWESLHQSRLFAYSASDGAPLPVQQIHGSLRSQCAASVCHFELRCALGGGRGSHSRCSRAAGSLRL